MIRRVVDRLTWLSYKREIRQRWLSWDRAGGGKHAGNQIKPFQLLSRPSSVPIEPNDPILQNPRFRSSLPFQTNRIYREYVYHIRKPCYIEPGFGYVIMEPAVLIPDSLAWSHFARVNGLLHLFSGVPLMKEYEAARQGKRSVRREQAVVSLRHVFDANYGHCLIQLMTALLLLDECGVSPQIPIVVSSQLGHLPFFQEMIQRGVLRSRRWIVQDASYIYAQEVIFAATEWPSQSLLSRFLDAIEVPQGAHEAQRRLFILRRSRQLSNMDALLPALDSFGFDRVRPEEFTFAQQIKLFSQAGIVCGAVGAALTNVIFRRDASAKVLEIQASTEPDIFFHGLAKTCGYSHHYLIGSRYETDDRYSNFSVEPERFRAFLSDAVASI